jgi:hypothetical protein
MRLSLFQFRLHDRQKNRVRPLDFAGHSLGAGFITSAASSSGVSEIDIMRVSRHKSVAILRDYVRRATVFEKAPLTSIFGESATR